MRSRRNVTSVSFQRRRTRTSPARSSPLTGRPRPPQPPHTLVVDPQPPHDENVAGTCEKGEFVEPEEQDQGHFAEQDCGRRNSSKKRSSLTSLRTRALPSQLPVGLRRMTWAPRCLVIPLQAPDEADHFHQAQGYFGQLVRGPHKIWELNYSGEKVSMFRVRCARLSTVRKEDQYFTTMVLPEAGTSSSSTNVTAQNEPWVLAKHVSQCFFITDPSKPSRVVLRRGKRNIIGMDGIANEDEFDQYGDPNFEDDDEDDDDDNTPYTLRRSRTTLPTRGGLPFKRRSHNVGLSYATKTKKGKKTAKR